MNVLQPLLTYGRAHRVHLHLLFWLCVLLLTIATNYFGDESESYSVTYAFIHAVAIIAIQIPSSYFLAYLIVPRVVEKKQYVSTALYWFGGAYALSVLSRILVVHFAEPLILVLTGHQPEGPPESIGEISTDFYKLFRVYFYLTFSIPFVFLAFKFFKAQHELTEKALTLEKAKVSAELKLLKAQLNPHFLFNTLNNIYSLSLDNSPQTSPSIGRLAEILDYILYRSSAPFVSISKEAHIMENYCELEKLRYDERLQFDLFVDIQADVEMIPMVFISLVENAFKHGASEDSNHPKIEVKLVANANHIDFSVMNSLVKDCSTDTGPGIGLTNIKQQLALLYPGKHRLEITKEDTSFHVHLRIELLK